MWVPFIQLTLHEPDKHQGSLIWVNMSRVQEFYTFVIDGEQVTELVMNIPDCVVHVMESPADILHQLLKLSN